MTDLELSSEETITCAIIADTHIPDRVRELHPELVNKLISLQPRLIIHAGDISHPRVIAELEQFAPVYAVRGNRDWLFTKTLPLNRTFLLNNRRVFLTHGHLNFHQYWKDKMDNLLLGYNFERYSRRLLAFAPDANVLLFGHSHHAECRNQAGVFFMNPGSCSVAEKPDHQLSFGIIRFSPGGIVSGELVRLN